MQTILVTGSTGYLGGRVVAELASHQDFRIRIAVRNRQNVLWKENVDIVDFDLFNSNSLRKICEGIDCVVHLAAANEILSANDPAEALKITGIGTLNLAEAASQANCKKFIFISTNHVYGQMQGKVTESQLPLPWNHYGITHKVAEDYLQMISLKFTNLNCVILRLSNCVGAPQSLELNRWSLLGNSICRQAAIDRKIVLQSSGLAHLDLLPITDAIRAIQFFINERIIPPAPKNIFNVGGKTMRVLDFANLVSDRTQSLLNFRPSITTLSQTREKGRSLDPFTYSSKHLKNMGFQYSSSIEQEIDQFLLALNQASHFPR